MSGRHTKPWPRPILTLPRAETGVAQAPANPIKPDRAPPQAADTLTERCAVAIPPPLGAALAGMLADGGMPHDVAQRLCAVAQAAGELKGVLSALPEIAEPRLTESIKRALAAL